MEIIKKNAISVLRNFKPAFTNLWDFEYISDPNAPPELETALTNIKYLITAIDLEGWSFKYDFIPSEQRNVITGIDRPTKFTITITDTQGLGVLDALITFIHTKLFSKTKSTIKQNSGIIGEFNFHIINPYFEEGSDPFTTKVYPTEFNKEFYVFSINCHNVRIGTIPPIQLNRTEARPISYSISFLCDYIDYASDLPIISPIVENYSTLEKNRNPYTNIKVPDPPDSIDQNKNYKALSGNNLSNNYQKFLNINNPVFSNMFYADFKFGIPDLDSLNRNTINQESFFNDIMIESASIDGYNLDYNFSESLVKHTATKIDRPKNISLTILDSYNLIFLTTLYNIIKNYYYDQIEGAFITGVTGKEMDATFAIYSPKINGVTELQYYINATGLKIAKVSGLSLNYTNSDILRYTVELVSDNIIFLNKDDLEIKRVTKVI